MTEEEAKDKWCPHARQCNEDGIGSFNRDWYGKIGDALCVASDCMMWEPEYEEESMDISENDKTPKGWHEKSGGAECSRHKYNGVIGESRLVFRYVKIASGDCGLKTKESGCFYPG